MDSFILGPYHYFVTYLFGLSSYIFITDKAMDAEKEANRLLKMALDNIKDEDYTHRGFLKPIEIALKTYET